MGCISKDVCSKCGKIITNDDFVAVDEKILCQCQVMREQSISDPNTTVCTNCYDVFYYTYCNCESILDCNDSFNCHNETFCSNCCYDIDLSHRTSTCGLHVHIGREQLGENLQEQENTIANLLFLVEAHWNELLRFSRRTEDSMNRWASRYGYRNSPKEILNEAKLMRCGRYAAVNITNDCTIELRIFRGTLKYRTFCATLQLVQELCEVAFSMSEKELKGQSWGGFVTHISSTHTDLVEYLKERYLYINDPVSVEEDV